MGNNASRSLASCLAQLPYDQVEKDAQLPSVILAIELMRKIEQGLMITSQSIDDITAIMQHTRLRSFGFLTTVP